MAVGTIKIDSKEYKIEGLVENGDRIYVDANKDGKYDSGEKQIMTKEELKTLLSTGNLAVNASGSPYSIDQVLSSISDTNAAKTAAGIVSELQKIQKALDNLKGDNSDYAKQIKESLATEAQQLYNAFKQIQTEPAAGVKNAFDALVSQLKNGHGIELEKSSSSGSGGGGGAKAAVTSDGDGKAAQAQPKAGYSYGSAMNTPMGGGAGGGGFMGSDGKFSMNNYLASTYNDQNIMNSWDQVNKNQSEQKKMMMLFFYFARMAASGDMGAMYRFMQFITWIISKDKALMNINMASKVIELENRNREALQELLDAPVPDSSDQKGQYEFTKIMERTKAMESSVATSQKLIAQMMEEMSQVVEALTSSTMESLHANGRIMRTVSRSG